MELKNIKKLVKLQLKQKLQLLLFVVVMLSIFCISSIYNFFNTLGESGNNFILDINGNNLIISILFIPFLSLLSTNILSNNEIKMYPGTIRTRYISRLITDHICIVLSYFVILSINIVLDLIAVIAKLFGKPLNISGLFDIKYWIMGFVIYVSLGFMVYMCIAFINTVFSKIPALGIIAIALFVYMLFKNKIFDFNEFIYNVKTFYFSPNIGIGTIAIRALITWFVFLIFGYLLTFVIKSWDDEFPQFKIMVTWIIELFIFTITATNIYFESSNETSEPIDYSTDKYSYTKEYYMDIPKDVSTNELQLDYDIEKYDYPIYVASFSYNEAVKYGLIDKSIEIPDGKMFVRLYSPKILVNNKEINKNLLDSIEIDLKNETVNFTEDYRIYLTNNFLGNLFQFEKDYHAEYEESYSDFGVIITLVYND